ncbi:MAG: hypothetical protein LBP83_09145 [Dysgonamonadaceae bacterium]|jgi:phosphate transport system protein|nr:hypothetical protein [Dysgonamonadaceae bacterium]
MNSNIKSRQIDSLDKKFQALCEKVLQQLTLAEEILRKNRQDDLYEKVNQIEADIDLLENGIRVDVVTLILYAPKATELRKLITYQDITNFLEAVGDLLVDMIFHPIKKINTNLPEFNYFQVTLEKMLAHVKKMISDAIFSFCYEDSEIAYKIIEEDDLIDDMFNDLSENIILLFQDLSLNEQELLNTVNINNIAYIIEQIGDIATNIAEASIYMIEGTDIRHQLSKKK